MIISHFSKSGNFLSIISICPVEKRENFFLNDYFSCFPKLFPGLFSLQLMATISEHAKKDANYLNDAWQKLIDSVVVTKLENNKRKICMTDCVNTLRKLYDIWKFRLLEIFDRTRLRMQRIRWEMALHCFT